MDPNSVSRAKRSVAEPTSFLQHHSPTASDALRTATLRSASLSSQLHRSEAWDRPSG